MSHQVSWELNDVSPSFRGHRSRCSTDRSRVVDPCTHMHSDPLGCPSYQDELVGGGWRQRGAVSTLCHRWHHHHWHLVGCQRCVNTTVSAQKCQYDWIWGWVLITPTTRLNPKALQIQAIWVSKSTVNALSTLDKHLFLSLTECVIGGGTTPTIEDTWPSLNPTRKHTGS